MPHLYSNQKLGHSPDLLEERQNALLHFIRQTLPELMSDNQLDFNKLKSWLDDTGAAAPDEHYELTWAGKTDARREVQKTTSHTLRPSADNPAQAGHMLIEGENLEVLRVLQRSYYGKVKMIYIDPPYNTGNDSFVYPDDYSETLDEYQKRTGEKNEAGYLNKQSLWKKSSKESGQYHSAWLSMMYPRLYLARNLLRDDGVIFISIDDNEAANLKLLCDEVFGAENFIDSIIWKKRYGGGAKEKHLVTLHEYVLFYAKNIEKIDPIFIKTPDESIERYYKLRDDNFELRGPFRTHPLEATKSMGERPNLVYGISAPNGDVVMPQRQWLWGKDRVNEALERDELHFIKDRNGKWSVHTKQYLKDEDGTVRQSKAFSIIEDVFTQHGTNEIIEAFGNAQIFSFPKPTKFIEKLLSIGTEKSDESIVLDFFAGSGTTAHAVMALNAEDGGARQSISVQMPEALAEDSEAYKAGYRTIADITRARIAKVIEKLKAEYPDKTTDLACAHFTLAPSNFQVWRSHVDNPDALREQLALLKKAEKSAPQDPRAMLAELLFKHGLGALGGHAKSDAFKVGKATVHGVQMQGERTMWLCFDSYTTALKDALVKARPAQVVLLNSCFSGAKADEQLSNLQLELATLDIRLTVI